MITEKHANVVATENRQPRQLRHFLPLVIGAGAFVIYLITLHRWVSFNSLTSVAFSAGWVWEPRLTSPLFWLVTFPFRWLPAAALPLIYNLFSAVCGTLTVMLLARSVMLLPHDRTHPQRLREKSEFSLLTIREAWVAPLIAAIVCGLQLTFWEHATSGSPEMLDVLLFAYVIRCLLEFRIQERQSWLTRAAFIYGLGITNNWALLGFLPVFIAAIIWIKGFSFFNLRFLGQIALCGLAGLSLYLLLPLVQSLSQNVPVPFWQGLKMNIGSQKGVLTQLYQHGRPVFLLLSLFSLVPIFLISIRWASYFGDTSPFGVAMATIMFHVVHAVMLVACLWVALDPPFSPRHKGFGFPFLTFYYLGALSVGYFVGYFLLVFGTRPGERNRRMHPLLRRLNQAVVVGVWVAISLVSVTLLYLNWPQIRLSNGPATRTYATLMAEALPKQGGVVLSDDPRQLLLIQALVAPKDTARKCLFLDTRSLKWPGYHRYLVGRYGAHWPFSPPKDAKNLLDDLTLFRMVVVVGQTNELCYIHPTFGYYLEQFFMEPEGLAYHLRKVVDNQLLPPALKPEVVARNETFWHDQLPHLEQLTKFKETSPAQNPSLIERLLQKAHLKAKPGRDASLIAGFYSRARTYWGVETQKRDQLAEAGNHFQSALQLNPDNIVAEVNAECNRRLQTGAKSAVQLSKSVEDAFGKYRNWEQILGDNGPFDEPNFCFEQGRVFFGSKLYHQAAQQFDRVRRLSPEHAQARLWLAQLYVLSNQPDEALKLVQEIHDRPDKLVVQKTNLTDLLLVEASAYLAKNDDQNAEAAVQRIVEKSPTDENLLMAASHAFITYGRFTNALNRINQQLKLTPDSPQLLINKGYVCLQIKDYAQAIPPLTKALALETNNHSARLNRAIAHLGAQNLDEAQQDYEALQKVYPTAYQVYYGLGEVAYLKHDTNAAIRNYQLYLTNSPPDNPEAQLINDRLKALKANPP